MQGYKYHVWKINDSISVCIRCSIHSQLSDDSYCNLFVLPEWNEKRQTWSKDLDAQTAVMFTNEIHDNSCKFSRWTIQSVLGGVQKMRFGFVQRADSKAEAHKLIGTFTRDTQSFLTQMNINMANCWATLRDVVATVFERKEQQGEFLFIKEPQSVTYRLIKMTEEESDSEQEEEDDENTGL